VEKQKRTNVTRELTQSRTFHKNLNTKLRIRVWRKKKLDINENVGKKEQEKSSATAKLKRDPIEVNQEVWIGRKNNPKASVWKPRPSRQGGDCSDL